MQGNVLRGVLTIGEVRHTDQGDLSLLSLESYDDGFRLHWRITSAAAQTQDPTDLRWGGLHALGGHAEDDLGNEYEGMPGGFGADARHASGEAKFTPAIADGATRLRLRLGGMDLASMMMGARSAEETYPWTFEISLADMKVVST